LEDYVTLQFGEAGYCKVLSKIHPLELLAYLEFEGLVCYDAKMQLQLNPIRYFNQKIIELKNTPTARGQYYQLQTFCLDLWNPIIS
jgi:hypothetical protein